jgi:hypothetical protein
MLHVKESREIREKGGLKIVLNVHRASGACAVLKITVHEIRRKMKLSLKGHCSVTIQK